MRKPQTRPREVYLEGKHPAVDYLVEVWDSERAVIGLLFLQVRASRRTVGGRLGTALDFATLTALARMPIPAYFLGVDATFTRTLYPPAYLVGFHGGERTGFGSVRRDFNIADDAVMMDWHGEAVEHWNRVRAVPFSSKFRHAND